MKTILAIDTSCDDTSVAITRCTTALSNVVASQTELHKPYGGVFPTVAKQAHKENIYPSVAMALKKARMKWDDIDAIAVTQGPGLAPALEVGINAALELAERYNKPLIPVNHVEGHVLSVHAKPNSKVRKGGGLKNSSLNNHELTDEKQESGAWEKIKLPALSIIISGKTSQFILVTKNYENCKTDMEDKNNKCDSKKSYGRFTYQILGTSVDDAAGECLDKVGRMLGLGYPAGPVIETLAKDGDPNSYKFPLPMTTVKNYNLSFSGLKTYARNLIEKEEADSNLNKTQILDFCASFQKAVFRHICYKLNKILQSHEINEIWLGGGVAANVTLRKMLRETIKKNQEEKAISITRTNPDAKLSTKVILRVPYTKKLCSDNAVMIGVVGGVKLANINAKNISILSINPNKKNIELVKKEFDRKPRWSVEEIK